VRKQSDGMLLNVRGAAMTSRASVLRAHLQPFVWLASGLSAIVAVLGAFEGRLSTVLSFGAGAVLGLANGWVYARRRKAEQVEQP
jgi:hypothetical protein